MKKVFADTWYWIARANPQDPWRPKLKSLESKLKEVAIITTYPVLNELLAHFSDKGQYLRTVAYMMATAILSNNTVEVVPESEELFWAGMELYNQRPDKAYSLTDCISMVVMKDKQVKDVLTHDKHFIQEGFNALFRN